MITSYLVACPYPDCDWRGSLLPHDHLEAWRSAIPTTRVVAFQCPRCEREWQARVVGDDVVALPPADLAAR
jgi:hypothetical protein